MLKKLCLFVCGLFLLGALQAQSTLMDLIPSNTATHTAIQSGSWFNPAIWSAGTVPSDAAIVHIPSGIIVDYSGQSDAHIFAIRVDGEFTCTQTGSNDTTSLTFDTFVGTHMSKVSFHAFNPTDGLIHVFISPFDIEAHKAGTSGYAQAWNASALSHYSDGATTYEVTYEIGPDDRFNTYADALNGNTFVAEVSRNTIDDGIGVLGRHDWDSTQLSIGMTIMGEVEIIGQPKSVMAKLSADALSGQADVLMESSPQGWEVGDEILITQGGNLGASNNGSETAVIQSIAGGAITTTQNLIRNHEGRPQDELHCFVGNLDRNITFQSTHHSNVHQRGHFMAMHNPTNIQVRNAEFVNMGRTDKSRLLDDLVWDHWVEPVVFQSFVSALGQECSQLVKPPKEDITNSRGRYSIHIHRAGALNGTNMVQVTGNVVRGNPGWAITHHDSHANVSDNLIFDVTGAALVSEAGNETGFWDNNLIVDVASGHSFDIYEATLFYDDYLFAGDGLAMKGRGVICRGNVVAGANNGIGIMNMNAAINNTLRMDADALASFRPDFQFDQFPLDKNGYSKEGDGIMPVEIPLIMEDNTLINCSIGLKSIERDMGVNNESRSIFDNLKIWGATWGLRINYQADYSFRDLFISNKNTNGGGLGIQMYKHSHNQVFERVKLVDFGAAINTSNLFENGTGTTRKTRNNGFTPWVFIDLETENIGDFYDFKKMTNVSTYNYSEHPDNVIHLSSSELPTTRGITFALHPTADLEIDLGAGDLQFSVDGAITDRIGTYEFGIDQALAQGNLRLDYEERTYEFASQAKLEEYLTANGIYKDTTDNDQLYFILYEYVPDRTTYEYKAFPIRINIMNAPASGIYANAQIENPADLAPQNQLLSLQGTATQSSLSTSDYIEDNSLDPNASRAIDGNNNGRKNVNIHQYGLLPIGSSAVTQVEEEPWWELDLGESKIIEHIDIWNTVEINGSEQETLSPHFRNFYVLVSDVPFGNTDLTTARANATHEYYKNEEVIRWFHLDNLNITGRYIRIQAEGYTKIGIAEVDVIGRDIANQPDCNGVVGGLAYTDECGVCVEGDTGLEPCELDCALVWGGTAYIDSCGNCVGGTTGITTPVEIPCNGIDDDCDPTTLDAAPANDSDGDGVCDINDVCMGSDPNTSCNGGLTCIESFTISNDCHCAGQATIPLGLTNLALGKTATQVSTNNSGDPSRAVDGDTNGTFSGNSVTQTTNVMNAWWEVDLGAVENIGIINVHNRTGGTADRLSNFYVLVSDNAFASTNLNDVLAQSGVSAYFFTDYPDPNIGFTVNRTGQYVRIQLAGQNVLNIAEVEVIEMCDCAADVDTDWVCDDVDACIGHDDNQDMDSDGIPDGCDTCDDRLIGTSCDDGNSCTYNDAIQADCSCAGTLYYGATQKMVNASFETGDFDSWARLYNGGNGASNITIGGDAYCDGSFGVEYAGGSVSEQLYTDVTNLTVGDSYTLYFWMSGDSADCYIGPTHEVFTGTHYNVGSGGSSTYVQQTLTFVATVNTMRIWFDFSPNTSVKLDAFSFDGNVCSNCSDGVQNGDETGVDCGGSSCRPCVEGCMDTEGHNYSALAELDFCACETCDDGIQNGDETAIDCGGAKCLPCALLPVELISFDGTLVEESILLEWATLLEENTEGFEIHKSHNATDWETIGFQEASNTGSRYQFWDDSPYSGHNYYRLKVVDKDGHFEYTNIITVFFERTASTLQAFPNPTNGTVTIKGSVRPNVLVKLEMIDVFGRSLWKERILSDATGLLETHMDISYLPVGVYYLQWSERTGNLEVIPIMKKK